MIELLKNIFRKIKKKLFHFVHGIDYRFFVPCMAALPSASGMFLFGIRGFIHGIFDYDWRSMALGQRYVRKCTYLAMKNLRPELNVPGWVILTQKKFINYSLEEWEASQFNKAKMKRFFQKSNISGLSNFRNVLNNGQGAVLVSTHWGSFCMGMVLLGMHGIKTNVLNTIMIEDERIHPAVRLFFNKKYRSMEMLMGGRMPYYEIEMDYLYSVLEEGKTVVLLVDTPGSKSSVYIPFMNRTFRVPLGAWKMANNTGSALGAFVCYRTGIEHYRIVISSLQNKVPSDPVMAMKPLYGFLESYMMKEPQKWLAAEYNTSMVPSSR